MHAIIIITLRTCNRLQKHEVRREMTSLPLPSLKKAGSMQKLSQAANLRHTFACPRPGDIIGVLS